MWQIQKQALCSRGLAVLTSTSHPVLQSSFSYSVTTHFPKLRYFFSWGHSQISEPLIGWEKNTQSFECSVIPNAKTIPEWNSCLSSHCILNKSSWPEESRRSPLPEVHKPRCLFSLWSRHMRLKAEFNFNRLCVYAASTNPLCLHQLHGWEL